MREKEGERGKRRERERERDQMYRIQRYSRLYKIAYRQC